MMSARTHLNYAAIQKGFITPLLILTNSDQIWHGLVSDTFVFRKGNDILIIIDGLNV